MKASGNLLPSLALLDQLQELHLDRNWFNGTLPPAYAYGFPSLVRMRLDFNSLTVRGPAFGLHSKSLEAERSSSMRSAILFSAMSIT